MTRLGWAWTFVAVLLLGHQLFLWTGGLEVETNLLALLPGAERDPAEQAAIQRVSEAATRSVVVLITGPSEEQSRAAADLFVRALPTDRLLLQPTPDGGAAAVAGLLPHRLRLLTRAQAAGLAQQSPEALTRAALLQVLAPVGPHLGAFAEDPLALFAGFLRERAAATRLRPVEGHLMLGSSVLLRYQTRGAGFSFEGAAHLAAAIAGARAALPPDIEVLATGVPLFAEAAAVQASGEMGTVGVGSLVAILVLIWLAFRSPRPLLLVGLSVAVGVAAGLSACALLFGKVHLIALVFGAGLVGVAEDYGIHYFASRQAQPGRAPRELLRHLTPGLFLATLTSVAGYAILAIAPLPGLRQVAVFSSVGLLAAFFSVLAWFPALDRGTLRATRFSAVWSATRAWWPAPSGRATLAGVALAAALAAPGLTRLSANDDVRALQASPPALIEAQRTIGARVGLPSPAQFFVVTGETEALRLEREEALGAQLDAFVARGALEGYDAISSWVPSPRQQEVNRLAAVRAREAVLAALSDELEPGPPPSDEAPVLTVATLLSTPVGEALAPLWSEGASVVLLREPQPAALEGFAALPPLEGVRFVDRTGSMSSLLRRWRVLMGQLLPGGYALVFLALSVRFRRRAWRALLPTAVASALAIATVGMLGEQLTLFHALALWVLLGMGVDYGIFLLEHPTEAGEAWLAVGLGALSTLLSFGLLALSRTAAIHAFGLVLGVGITLVLLLSPLTAPRA